MSQEDPNKIQFDSNGNNTAVEKIIRFASVKPEVTQIIQRLFDIVLQSPVVLQYEKSGFDKLRMAYEAEPEITRLNLIRTEREGLDRTRHALKFVSLLAQELITTYEQNSNNLSRKSQLDALRSMYINNIRRNFHDGMLEESGTALQLLELLRYFNIISDPGYIDFFSEKIRKYIKDYFATTFDLIFLNKLAFETVSEDDVKSIMSYLIGLLQFKQKVDFFISNYDEIKNENTAHDMGLLNFICYRIERSFLLFINKYVDMYFRLPGRIESRMILHESEALFSENQSLENALYERYKSIAQKIDPMLIEFDYQIDLYLPKNSN